MSNMMSLLLISTILLLDAIQFSGDIGNVISILKQIYKCILELESFSQKMIVFTKIFRNSSKKIYTCNTLNTDVLMIMPLFANPRPSDFSILLIRMDSFITCTHLTYARKLILAKSGFYFIGGTNFKCYGCGVVRNVFENVRDLDDCHLRDCLHHRQFQPDRIRENFLAVRQNYIISEFREYQTMSDIDLGKTRRREFSTEENLSEYVRRTKGSGFIPATPLKYPQFALLQNRESTFQQLKFSLPNIWKDVAKAGFFYHRGKFVCFCCGIELPDLEVRREPYQIHASVSPSCRHIRQVIDTRNTMYSSPSLHVLVSVF